MRTLYRHVQVSPFGMRQYEHLASLDRTIATLAERLLERRTEGGYWEGRLASSALSTATALIALVLLDRATGSDHGPRIRGGIRWVAANQNEDGGWGDTVLSASNLSTTALCWAALSIVADDRHLAPYLDRAEGWLRSEMGSLEPRRLREAIVRRYGKDRTFSVPILTVLALAGRLGDGRAAWRRVPQLPFELAALPHGIFRFARLPVVSYALPALIAIGQVRHCHAPTRNPLLRAARAALRLRTLHKLRSMQPESGGYLEATPLTAFVVMSLISAGESRHPVVEEGVRFLLASARSDGSWPIDTNLATWVTTWAVKVLSWNPECGVRNAESTNPFRIPNSDFRIVEWLLAHQLRDEHPFTQAAPGGWAWTNLSGGVPDADDTSGALIALSRLARDVPEARESAKRGIAWLLDVQNADGGIPTFCRGWGALPFDRSAPDLTAHALEAWSAWYSSLDGPLRDRVSRAAQRAIAYLSRCQRPDGSWMPLWFGNQHVDGESNPVYGTARVTAALAARLARDDRDARRCRTRAVEWLVAAQNGDGGWGGTRGAPSSLEETGLALQALSAGAGLQVGADDPDARDHIDRGVQWLIEATREGRRTPASPIGLYFARLWYFEEMYPILFSLAGLTAVRTEVEKPAAIS